MNKISSSQLQSLFSSAIRSEWAWRLNAQKLVQSAILILNEALRAKERYDKLISGSTRELTKEELQTIDDFRQHEVGFFLVALATENILKGLWVAQNQALIGNVSHIKKDLGDHFGHDQILIARKCGLSISADEQELLEGFKSLTEWFGKYHVPIKVEEYRSYLKDGPLAFRLFQSSTFEDPLSPRVTAILERLLIASNDASKLSEGHESVL